MFSMFLFGFGMASVAKAQQKMSNPCTSKSRNLELHFTMSVLLLAASLNFQLYWRALPSFPVLANTGIYIYNIYLRGRPPWPFETHFAQKGRQSRSHELPLLKKLQKDATKCLQGCHIGHFIETLRKNGIPRTPKVV